MSPALDDTDRRLLDALVADGRISVNELARATSVSRATAYARLERLQSEGVISGFSAQVDPAALGYAITALVLVNVEQGDWADVRVQLVALPGFEYLAVTSGGFDFLVLVRVSDIAELRDVVLHRLHRMAAVKSTQTVFVLDEERRPLAASPAQRPA
ncbi:MAG TPA: Lrp/AsnC family transcriptional regulator [Acidimicrobiales bacterium]|nr:Lrp/AsnC family transcriptional regulator [Acidimicrobiales bacterium]